MWLLLALAFPAVFINLGQAHNGFLTAALIGAALVQLDRRPVVAGVLIGLLAYKPQFGVLIPLVLAVSGRWRVFASAAVTLAVMTLAVTFAFGADVWSAFLATGKFTRTVVLEQGGTGWYKIQSVFSWVRMWGGGIALAYVVQAAVTVTIAAALAWLWRSRAAYPLKAAALLIGTLLATPYSLDYDLMLLAPAIGYLAYRRIRARLRRLRKNGSCRAVDSSADSPLRSASHADSASSSNHVAGLRHVAAPRHERMRRDAGQWHFAARALK